MLSRPELTARVAAAMRRSPATLLVGPRQCGKTTLARTLASRRDRVSYFDLEDPATLRGLAEPMTALRPLAGLVVLDEVQRRPDLFPVLRVLLDRRPLKARFLILGSASPAMLRQTSETLAGRVEIVEMAGFDLGEVGSHHEDRLWLRGGFPPSFLARSQEASLAWRESFLRTFLERDLPQIGLSLPATTLRRFWSMLAHYHGQTWNASEIGRSLGVSDVTTRRYLDVLTDTYMVRQLPPWFENIGKRQVKAPKVFIRDTGLLHLLFGITSHAEAVRHPKCGASWEGFAMEEVLRRLLPQEAYFWATHGEAELDLLVFRRGKRLGFEFKFCDAPAMIRSMGKARTYLRLDALHVIYPGERIYDLGEHARVIPLSKVVDELG
jgi:uncharacterized protein